MVTTTCGTDFTVDRFPKVVLLKVVVPFLLGTVVKTRRMSVTNGLLSFVPDLHLGPGYFSDSSVHDPRGDWPETSGRGSGERDPRSTPPSHVCGRGHRGRTDRYHFTRRKENVEED